MSARHSVATERKPSHLTEAGKEGEWEAQARKRGNEAWEMGLETGEGAGGIENLSKKQSP